MNKDFAKELMYILIAIVIGIIAVKFIIWILPIVIIGILSYYVYRSIKKNRKPIKKQTTKKKKVKIIDMVDEE